MKTFTLEEAQAVLPVVESLLARAMDARRAAAEIERDLQQLSRRIFLSGGMHVDVLAVNRERVAYDQHNHHAGELLAEIDSIGVEVKDLDTGLVDFPTLYRGNEVYLCWKLGETGIQFWHGIEEGFRGRKEIDRDFLDHHKGESAH